MKDEPITWKQAGRWGAALTVLVGIAGGVLGSEIADIRADAKQAVEAHDKKETHTGALNVKVFEQFEKGLNQRWNAERKIDEERYKAIIQAIEYR